MLIYPVTWKVGNHNDKVPEKAIFMKEMMYTEVAHELCWYRNGTWIMVKRRTKYISNIRLSSEHHNWNITVLLVLFENFSYAWTSTNSAGSTAFGCFDWKCCLYVFGSGISAMQTVHLWVSAFMAAAFWSLPFDFFNSSCFFKFFCCDWIFWWPRAIELLFQH